MIPNLMQCIQERNSAQTEVQEAANCELCVTICNSQLIPRQRPDLAANGKTLMAVEDAYPNLLRHGAADGAVHRIGEWLDAPALQVALFIEFKQNVAAIHKTIGGLGIIGQDDNVLRTARLHGGERFRKT